MLTPSPPFALGEVLQGKDSDNALINSHWLGAEYTFPVPNPSGDLRGNKTRLTGKTVTAVILRNTSGGTLLGKRIGRLERTAGYDPVQSVDQYAIVLAEKGIVIIDSWLDSNGVPDDYLFWGIIKGPCEVLTPVAGAGFNAAAIAVGDLLVAATGATSNNSDYGRIAGFALANNTDAAGAFSQSRNTVATALSARTSGNTNAALLVNANILL